MTINGTSTRPPKAALLVAQRIVQDALRENRKPGDLLVPERTMVEKYGAGRGTVREALRLLEVQGFGQRFIDASGATLGTITIKANAISRYITFSVPKSALGTPTSGWGFAVVLTGQDGFSPDQARGFQTTPQDFQFGVCATASSDPHCTVDPATVPKAMDVITPTGVLQSEELDYTLHPVTIAPVVIP